MKTFDDLIFNPHKMGYGAVQARMDLGNDIEVSVVGGKHLYGNGVTSFEVAAFYQTLGKFVPLDGNDVSGWNSKEEVTKIINYLENL